MQLYTFTQFGSAVGIFAVTAVYGIAAVGADSSPGAVLDAYRAALVVPVVMVLLGAAVSAFGLVRRARPADGRRKGAAPAARDEASDGVPG
ncbi:hypothetical protein ACWET9_40950 [Streptomyces sp. NPDC004059]